MTDAEIIEYMNVHFRYDPDSGDFIIIKPQSNRSKSASVAGYVQENGYRRIAIRRKFFQAHRLVWLWHNGSFPKFGIDHINRVKHDNRIENLREADQKLNSRNASKPRKNNTTGFLGVSPSRGKFAANIFYDGRARYLGRFAKAEDAHNAYLEAKKQYHAGAV